MRTRAHSTMYPTKRDSSQIYRSNLNNFDYLITQPYHQTEMSFISQLRAPIEVITNVKKRVEAPNCFGKTITSQAMRHEVRDLPRVENVGQYEHLLRNRVGMKPSQGQVIFETSLRSYNIAQSHAVTRDNNTGFTGFTQSRQNTQEIDKVTPRKPQQRRQQISRVEESRLSIGYGPEEDIMEKNMSTYEHCLKEKGGTVKQSTIKWLVSLKNYQNNRTVRDGQRSKSHSVSMSMSMKK